jgi:hypothetical protein
MFQALRSKTSPLLALLATVAVNAVLLLFPFRWRFLDRFESGTARALKETSEGSTAGLAQQIQPDFKSPTLQPP